MSNLLNTESNKTNLVKEYLEEKKMLAQSNNEPDPEDEKDSKDPYPNSVYDSYPNSTYDSYPNSVYDSYPNSVYDSYPNSVYDSYPNSNNNDSDKSKLSSATINNQILNAANNPTDLAQGR